MEPLKHECGVAMIRLRRPLEYYREKYGSYSYPLDKLYLLMEKQHNRGQEAAGVGVVKLNSNPGNEYVFRERALGTGAIDEIFATIGSLIPNGFNSMDARTVEAETPFLEKGIWVICVTALRDEADWNIHIRSCDVTIGARVH